MSSLFTTLMDPLNVVTVTIGIFSNNGTCAIEFWNKIIAFQLQYFKERIVFFNVGFYE